MDEETHAPDVPWDRVFNDCFNEITVAFMSKNVQFASKWLTISARFTISLLMLMLFLAACGGEALARQSTRTQVQTRAQEELRNGQLLDEVPRIDRNSIRGTLILDIGRTRRQSDFQLAAGPRTGGGGNACALVIYQATQQLINFPENPIEPHDVSQLHDAINRAKFYVADKPLVINNESKDAINFSDTGEIFISRRFCDQELIEVSGRTLSLLLHEYLGIAKIDDRRFEISGHFLERYAMAVSETAAAQRSLEVEVAKDLRGQSRCLNGIVRKLYNELETDFGGRFDGTYSVYLVPSSFVTYRSPTKYCERDLDSRLRPTEVESQIRYRQCTTDEEQSFVGSVVFRYSTTGTLESKAVNIEYKVKTKTTLIVTKDADDFPDDNQVHSHRQKISYECLQLRSSTKKDSE